MNHIVMGTDATGVIGLVLGLIGLSGVVAVCALAHWFSWHAPRGLQRFAKATVGRVMGLAFDRMTPRAEYLAEAISPYFWPNGKLPVGETWNALAASDFQDYRLEVSGLVENPVELTLAAIQAMPKQSHTTLHNCVQGWSGIAQWGGLPFRELIALVRPRAEARVVVFHSFGEGGEGGLYYDSHTIEDLRHPQSLLAYEMNHAPLTILHGAPLRLRVENQLGYKQVKWIRSIEFLVSTRPIEQGEGGYNEDHEYYGCKAEI